jgi:hypothetical protein
MMTENGRLVSVRSPWARYGTEAKDMFNACLVTIAVVAMALSDSEGDQVGQDTGVQKCPFKGYLTCQIPPVYRGLLHVTFSQYDCALADITAFSLSPRAHYCTAFEGWCTRPRKSMRLRSPT